MITDKVYQALMSDLRTAIAESRLTAFADHFRMAYRGANMVNETPSMV